MEILVNAAANPHTPICVETLLAPVRAKGTPPDFITVHGSASHALSTVSEALAALGAGAVHGATSCRGVMARGAMVGEDGDGLGCFAIWDADGGFGSALQEIDGDPFAAGRAAALAAVAAAGRAGEAPDLVWLSAVPGQEEQILAGIESVVGANTPIVGGSAADDAVAGGWLVFNGTTVSGTAIVVSALFPSRPLSSAYQSGYAPAAPSGTVTAGSGRIVSTIDHQPAAEVYRAWTSGAVPGAAGDDVSILAQSTLHPLGRAVTEVSDVPFYLLAHPATVRPDGAIALFAEVQEGEQLQLMTGSVESLVSRAGRVASLAARRGRMPEGSVAGALMIYCGGCRLAVGDAMAAVARDVDEALHHAPSLGIFTFGEQGAVVDGANHHGNLMISCITFAK